jgi:hypothetical protein
VSPLERGSVGIACLPTLPAVERENTLNRLQRWAKLAKARFRAYGAGAS